MTAEEWAWFAAYSGKTDRRDAFTAILAKQCVPGSRRRLRAGTEVLDMMSHQGETP
jgi:hypothetical protein